MNYPEGMRASYDYDRPMHCADGHSWTARFRYDLGMHFPVDDDDGYCPECGREGE